MGYIYAVYAELVSKSGKSIFDAILYIASSPSPLILSEEVLTAEKGKSERSGYCTSRLAVLRQSWAMYSVTDMQRWMLLASRCNRVAQLHYPVPTSKSGSSPRTARARFELPRSSLIAKRRIGKSPVKGDASILFSLPPPSITSSPSSGHPPPIQRAAQKGGPAGRRRIAEEIMYGAGVGDQRLWEG
ncbi:hypothetical protein FA13DRAFT_1778334 [Coprinellus micaceus]|uniref:Uncharacterized protein n=1 Tax=Coprinellus micaceus TaxID=71717 RepID=A0A4Y7SN84_COPMI|nr:hypothetical protein FA13DRAFT_1778334 [Coprinellus micaceus]